MELGSQERGRGGKMFGMKPIECFGTALMLITLVIAYVILKWNDGE